jgi:nucleotide-binding universal stress UspA family protein
MSRVLFATDLSEAAGVAERLIGSIHWPANTTFRVVTVVPWVTELIGTPWMAVAPLHADEIEDAQLKTARQGVQEAADRLTARGLRAGWVVMRGRPADAIVEVATTEHVDLVIVGSRGLGALEGALLGSVSEAVADRAPCPVLVARGERIERSLIADDGSPGAKLAVEYVRARPHLLGTETRLVAVADIAEVWGETFDLPIDAHSVQVLEDDRREYQAEVRRGLESEARELRDIGPAADVQVMDGRPAPSIVDAALACKADLVVVGSRHRTGVTRLVLGSVGRHVLHHSHCSVLLVGRAPEREAAAAPTPSETATPAAVS